MLKHCVVRVRDLDIIDATGATEYILRCFYSCILSSTWFTWLLLS